MTNSEDQLSNIETSQELDLGKLFRTLKRNWRSLIIISSTITSISLIYCFTTKPIYKGRFDIVVEDQEERDNSGRLSSLNSSLLGLNLKSFNESDLKSQELILKSPSVLLPVFKYVEEQELINNSKKVLDYKSWVRENLTVSFTEDTNVLSVIYKNENKKQILDVLKMISSKYQSYSKDDRKKTIERTIEYLTIQEKIQKNKALESRKALNIFSIENGLGDIDGFVNIENNSLPTNLPFSIKDIDKITSSMGLSPSVIKRSGAGLRYKQQFALLEQYESQYTILSSKLRPNSRQLKTLENKINQLKTSLKRPNKILIKFRELKKTAERNESILKNIEDKLAVSKLEKIKQQVPWQLISNPTIEKEIVWPQKKNIVMISFAFSLFIASINSIIKEKKSGILFEFDDIKEKLNIPFLETLYTDNLVLAKKIIIFNANKFDIKTKFGISYPHENISEKDLNKNLFENRKIKFESIDLFSGDSSEKCDKIFILIEQGKCTNRDIALLNQYSSIYKEKIIGWFYLTKLTS